MSKSTLIVKEDKPVKPYDDFPLFPHLVTHGENDELDVPKCRPCGSLSAPATTNVLLGEDQVLIGMAGDSTAHDSLWSFIADAVVVLVRHAGQRIVDDGPPGDLAEYCVGLPAFAQRSSTLFATIRWPAPRRFILVHRALVPHDGVRVQVRRNVSHD